MRGRTWCCEVGSSRWTTVLQMFGIFTQSSLPYKNIDILQSVSQPSNSEFTNFTLCCSVCCIIFTQCKSVQPCRSSAAKKNLFKIILSSLLLNFLWCLGKILSISTFIYILKENHPMSHIVLSLLAIETIFWTCFR